MVQGSEMAQCKDLDVKRDSSENLKKLEYRDQE